MSQKAPRKFPEKDPYKVLRVSYTASNAEIAKAYRQLARELHPDKHAARQDLSPSEIQAMKSHFHDIQVARSFLLDAEYDDERKQYVAKVVSELNRTKLQRVRETKMSERRKRMKEDLKQQEHHAKYADGGLNKNNQRNETEVQSINIEKLSKEGTKRQQEYADNLAAAELAEKVKKEKRMQDCQVRLKWSRKKIATSPSEHTIAEQLSAFGQVMSVEFLGSKGNAALVTFSNPSSCTEVVDYFADSNEMRATFVSHHESRRTSDSHSRKESPQSRETVENWRLRRTMEREHASRQMEDGLEHKIAVDKDRKMDSVGYTAIFPPERFQTNSSKNINSPLQWLEMKEEHCFGRMLSLEQMSELKILK